MATTRKRDRAFVIFVAGLFLVTSFGLSALVIWQSTHQNNSSNSNSATTASANTNKSTAVVGAKLTGFTPVSTVNSLQAIDLKVGTGKVAQASSTVSVYYTGALASNGVIFQSTSTTGQAATFALNQVIEGWSKGIPGMKVGGTRQLLIPANEAYGASPPSGSGIPPNAPLVFNVTLLSVQ
jgi:FKBP-type peptidyl-prolyl cis-trans isomerase FkpA